MTEQLEIVVTAKRLPRITARIACELIAHEGIVREAYECIGIVAASSTVQPLCRRD
ncbi:MAG: hypothetical protein V4696_01770 [Pseudomonadota bacterium]